MYQCISNNLKSKAIVKHCNKVNYEAGHVMLKLMFLVFHSFQMHDTAF